MAKRRPKLPNAGASFRIERLRQEPPYRMPSDFDYSPTGPKCADSFNKLAKGKCLVQFTFDQGTPAIRFCDTKGQPGKLVHVESPSEAAEVARLGCECYEATGSYADCLPEGLSIGAAEAATPEVMQVTTGKLPGLQGLPAGSFGKAPSKRRQRGVRGAGKPRGSLAGLPRGSACRRVGKLTTDKRNKLPSTAFGIPENRSYPMPDPSHAKNAKARAKAALNKGKLSRRDFDRVVRKANRVIRACGGKVRS